MIPNQKLDILLTKATEIAHVMEFNTFSRNFSGKVGCALLAKNGKIYSGVSIDLMCGLGNCAEYAAIAEMVKDHETEIDMIVAVYEGKGPISPCGRCRELMVQLDKRNSETKVILNGRKIVKLSDLLPIIWTE